MTTGATCLSRFDDENQTVQTKNGSSEKSHKKDQQDLCNCYKIRLRANKKMESSGKNGNIFLNTVSIKVTTTANSNSNQYSIQTCLNRAIVTCH